METKEKIFYGSMGIGTLLIIYLTFFIMNGHTSEENMIKLHSAGGVPIILATICMLIGGWELWSMDV